MTRVTVWRFHLHDGSEVTGEYLGAQEGWIYVGNGEQVDRLKQTDVSHYVPVETVDE